MVGRCAQLTTKTVLNCWLTISCQWPEEISSDNYTKPAEVKCAAPTSPSTTLYLTHFYRRMFWLQSARQPCPARWRRWRPPAPPSPRRSAARTSRWREKSRMRSIRRGRKGGAFMWWKMWISSTSVWTVSLPFTFYPLSVYIRIRNIRAITLTIVTICHFNVFWQHKSFLANIEIK